LAIIIAVIERFLHELSGTGQVEMMKSSSRVLSFHFISQILYFKSHLYFFNIALFIHYIDIVTHLTYLYHYNLLTSLSLIHYNLTFDIASSNIYITNNIIISIILINTYYLVYDLNRYKIVHCWFTLHCLSIYSLPLIRSHSIVT